MCKLNNNTENSYLEETQKINDFTSSIKKVKSHRIHKVNNSLGVYDAYKWIRKNKWLNIGKALTEHEFYSIIREINKELVDEFLKGYNIKFPHRMGQLELIKYNAKFVIENNKVKTNLLIDWHKTLLLWYKDREAFKNKTLVKMNESELYKVHYNKHSANYINKSFYRFKINRKLKKELKQKIKNKTLDALKYEME